MVFEEIMPHVAELVTDVFGNYVVQKVLFQLISTLQLLKMQANTRIFPTYIYFLFHQLMEHGTPFQRRKIIECLIGSASSLSFQQYGCRVIQRVMRI